MVIKVIRWNLNEVMARKRIRNKDLALVLGITETSVYRLRRTDEMPRLSPERLNGICAALECQPGELLQWIPDDDSTKAKDRPVSQTIQLSETTPRRSNERKSSKRKRSSGVVTLPVVAKSTENKRESA